MVFMKEQWFQEPRIWKYTLGRGGGGRPKSMMFMKEQLLLEPWICEHTTFEGVLISEGVRFMEVQCLWEYYFVQETTFQAFFFVKM